MPHVTLEYTDNLCLHQPVHELLQRIHAALADIAGIELANCKSRAVALERYSVGDGTPGAAFVHMDVRFIEGRAAECKAEVGRQLLAVLQQAFPAKSLGRDVQMTVEIGDIRRSAYFKYPEGTLGKDR